MDLFAYTHPKRVALDTVSAQEAAGNMEDGKLKSAAHAQKEDLAETTQETEHVF